MAIKVIKNYPEMCECGRLYKDRMDENGKIMKKKNEAPSSMGLQPGTKIHQWKECNVLLSPPYRDNGWHMSISHNDRYPSWDEIRDAWYALVPGSNNRIGALLLPKKKDYINVHPNCFQVMEIKSEEAKENGMD